MTWEIIITVPYSQDVVNVERLTIAFFCPYFIICSPIKIGLAVRNIDVLKEDKWSAERCVYWYLFKNTHHICHEC